MKKEITFNTTIEGKRYVIAFRQNRTKYELYVDGSLMANLNQSPDEENQEKDVKIGSKRCQFVLYGDSADLVVDGILKYEEYRELKNMKFHRNVLLGLGFAQILVGTFCALTWSAFQIAEMYSIGGGMGLVFSVAFTVAGVVEMLFGLRKQRQIKEWNL